MCTGSAAQRGVGSSPVGTQSSRVPRASYIKDLTSWGRRSDSPL